MSEYTFEDLIVDPETQGIENLIGKEVYYNNVPFSCISIANKDSDFGILTKVYKDTHFPFLVETHSGDIRNYICYSCIIPKKEESKSEPKYVPFKFMEEFVERYTEVRKNSELGSLNDNLFQCGMWLREKRHGQVSNIYCMVTEIWNCGVDVGSNRIPDEGNTIINDFTTWENLYLGYTFLDGSPCGKLEDLR